MPLIRPVLLLLLAIFVSGCSSTIALKQDYLNSQSRLGFIVIARLETTSGAIGIGPAGGIISSAFTPMDKYTATLNAISHDVNPTQKITELYLETFASKGRKLIPVKFSMDDPRIADFNIKNTNGLKKYHEKDLRFFRGDLEIDELLIVTIQYGIYAKYAYGIETSKSCYTTIKSQIVNLRDNSILYRDQTPSSIKLSDISDLNSEVANAIIKTTDQSISKQKEKFKSL